MSVAAALPVSIGSSSGCRTEVKCILVDDFESYDTGGLPVRWKTNQDRGDVVPVTAESMNEQERFVIKEENGNKFVRAIVNDQAHRLIMQNDEQMGWRLNEFPIISWDWRANVLPEGAREDRRNMNDTGAAVYVIFGKDWLGRPRSIKYSYSSSLKVGTTVSYGPLRVLVVSSAAEDGIGTWLNHERNVADDYRRLFGKKAPNKPQAIILWSDSDTIDSTSEADFDDIMLLSDASAAP